MTEHIASFEVLTGRDAAGPADQPQKSSITRHTQVVAGATFATGELSPGALPYSCFGGFTTPLRHLYGHVQTAAGPVAIEAVNGATWLAVNGTALANGVTPIALDGATARSRICRPTLLLVSGAAAAAIVAIGAMQSVTVEMHWAYPFPMGYMGQLHFCEFQDDPPDSPAVGLAVVSRLLQSIGRSGARATLGIASSGAMISVNACGFAAIGPDAQVWITAADIGNANEQIPADVGQNSAAHFRFHPSVFFRRTDYVRAINRQVSDAIALSAVESGQPITIAQILTAPTASDWFVRVDGSGYVVRLSHFGIDVRRPRDIWNQLWVPILQSSQAPSVAPVFLGRDSIQTGVAGVASRLRYLEYARFLAPVGATVTRNPQTGADPPPP